MEDRETSSHLPSEYPCSNAEWGLIERNATPAIQSDTEPDTDVFDLVGRGDTTEALRRLMRRHGTAVYRYCREALRDPMLADDVHQQVFIEAFRDLPKLRGRSTARIWLFEIARRRAHDAWNTRSPVQAHVENAALADTPAPRPSRDESLDDTRLHEALSAALGALDEEVRTAVLLRYQQGFTFEELADVCCEEPGMLHARVTRALSLLRARIKACTGGSP